MGAGHGIEHSEFNASKDAPVHFLQIWIQPDRVNAPPAHAQQVFDPQARRGRWTTLASPDGADGSLAIRQQAWLHGVRLGEGESASFALKPARRYWGSEERTSELQSQMRISYAAFWLQKK